jgi:RNA polymerase sigma-70 factor (ECF subfamily)
MSEIASGGSLVARILQGDQSAEEELVQVYWRAVFRIAMVRLRDRDAALDIVQDTFMTVLKEVRAGKLRDAEKIAGFIHGVENNFIKSFQRKRFRSLECDLDTYLDRMVASEVLIDEERRRLAQEAIHSLGATDQIILVSFFVDGRSLTEIAGRLGMSPESVRARKSRAIKKLKKKFNRMSHP